MAGTHKDVKTGAVVPLALPTPNVIKVHLEDDSWFCVRPSGTEAKLKIYFGVKGHSMEDGQQMLALVKQFVLNYIENT